MPVNLPVSYLETHAANHDSVFPRRQVQVGSSPRLLRPDWLRLHGGRGLQGFGSCSLSEPCVRLQADCVSSWQVWLLEMNCNPALHTNCEVLKEVVPATVVEALGQSSDANTRYVLNTDITYRFYTALCGLFQICPWRSSTNADSRNQCSHWPVRGTLCCCTTEKVLLRKPPAECPTRKTPKPPLRPAPLSQNHNQPTLL